jgi:hypothetical protein
LIAGSEGLNERSPLHQGITTLLTIHYLLPAIHYRS